MGVLAPTACTHTLHLRPDVLWSDGARSPPPTCCSRCRRRSIRHVKSVIAGNLTAGGEPIQAAAPDAATVVFTFAGPSGPGIGLLDVLTILPKHKLEAALTAGTFAAAWNPGTAPADIVGTGPFVLREYVPGQRLVFERNPRYWRKAADGAAAAVPRSPRPGESCRTRTPSCCGCSRAAPT